MKKEYSFNKAKRGPVVKMPPGKERITIRIDSDILNWFREQVEEAGGGNYQTLVNQVLRLYVQGQGNSEKFEKTLRRVIREELSKQKQVA